MSPARISAGLPRLPGLHLTLKADRLGSLEQGSPVFYRQIQVGQVKSFQLGDDQRTIEIKVHIEPAYADLVRKHTRFWNASGISISGGLSGFKVHSESLLTLVAGGIAFSTPENRTGAAVSSRLQVAVLPASFVAVVAQALVQPLGAVAPELHRLQAQFEQAVARRARQRAVGFRQAPGFGAQGVDVGEGFALPRGDRHRVGLVRAAQPLGVGALVGQPESRPKVPLPVWRMRPPALARLPSCRSRSWLALSSTP